MRKKPPTPSLAPLQYTSSKHYIFHSIDDEEKEEEETDKNGNNTSNIDLMRMIQDHLKMKTKEKPPDAQK